MELVSIVKEAQSLGHTSKIALHWYELGAALVDTEKYEDAIVFLERALDISVCDENGRHIVSHVYVSLGDALMNLHSYEKALSCYETADIDDFSLNSKAGSRITTIKNFLNKNTKLPGIVFMKPDSASFSVLGSSFANVYWADNATQVFERIVGSLGALDVDAWCSLGLQYFRLEKDKLGLEALKVCQSILLDKKDLIGDDRAKLLLELCCGRIGYAQLKCDNYDDAINSFRSCTILAPDSVAAWEHLGIASIGAKNRFVLIDAVNHLNRLDNSSGVLQDFQRILKEWMIDSKGIV